MVSEWFIECKRVLEQLQKERLAEEESIKDEKRARFLEELRPEINILDEVASKGKVIPIIEPTCATCMMGIAFHLLPVGFVVMVIFFLVSKFVQEFR